MNIEILKTQNTQENIPTTYLIRQSEYIIAKRMCEMSKYCTAVVIIGRITLNSGLFRSLSEAAL